MKSFIFLTAFLLTEVLNTDDKLFENNLSLVELDKRIIQGIMEPAEGQGDKLLNNTLLYLEYLKSISKMIKHEYKPDETEKLLREIKDFGGPHFLIMKVDLNKITNIFKWNELEKERFRTLLKELQEIWEDLDYYIFRLDGFTTRSTEPPY